MAVRRVGRALQSVRGGVRTHVPIHPVKHVILWRVVHILDVLPWIDSHVFHRHHNAGIVQQVPETKVPPPHWVAVWETCRRCARGDECVDGTRGARARACFVPCAREGVATFGECGVEL